MIQTILVFVVFAAAVFYTGRSIYRNFRAKSSCATGCGKCGVDFSKIEQKLEDKHLIS